MLLLLHDDDYITSTFFLLFYLRVLNVHFFYFSSFFQVKKKMSSIEDLFGKLAMTTVTTVSRIALSHATNAAIVSIHTC